MENIQRIVNDIIKWLQDRVEEANCRGLVFGLSGGIDSAVIAKLAKTAFPDNSLGIIMPCHSNIEDEEHSMIVADALDLEVLKVDLSKTFDILLDSVRDDNSHDLAVANIKPRLRMTALYYFAQKNNYLVVGTGNKSEFTLGYFTKHGDSGVDIFPIADFVKSEIRELAKYLNIPDIIITKSPSAGLWEGQTDEEEMGITYKDLDNYIKTGEAPDDVKKKIEKLNKLTSHKRKMPLMFKR